MNNPLVLSLVTLVAGIAVSLAVSGLKRIPFVNNYPKVVAGALSALVMALGSLSGTLPGGLLTVLVNSLAALATSIATYEIGKPIVEESKSAL